MRTFDHPHIIKKAVVDGTTVGYLSAGPNLGEPEAYEGEVYDIFVLEEYQKRGIGCRLLAAAADWFREMGYESVLIWCWEQNPSTAFYRRLGGSEVHHTQQTVAGKQLAVTVFGWELKDLEAALRSR
jgi:GNAT superfamily N-acetyltransferase